MIKRIVLYYVPKDNNSVLKHLDFIVLDLLIIGLSFFVIFGMRQGFGKVLKDSPLNLMMGIILIVHMTVAIYESGICGCV